MELVIHKKIPSKKELDHIITETKHFPNQIYVGPKTWASFDGHYCAYVDNNFSGILAVNRFSNWVKLGPLVVLSRYHGKGIGTKLVKTAIKEENKHKQIYLASANPAVWKIVGKLCFVQYKNISDLPWSVKLIYTIMSLKVLVQGEFLEFIKELIRKKRVFTNSSHHQHFFLPSREKM